MMMMIDSVDTAMRNDLFDQNNNNIDLLTNQTVQKESERDTIDID